MNLSQVSTSQCPTLAAENVKGIEENSPVLKDGVTFWCIEPLDQSQELD